MTNANIEKRTYDASCLSDYLNCPKYFYYRWLRKLVPVVEPAPLLFGRVFHEALSLHYQHKEMEECVAAFDKLPARMEDDRRSKERGKAIFKEYVERWGKDEEQYETMYVEIDFALDMPEGRVYVGRLDRVVKDVGGGQIYVKDHKTTSQLGLNFFRGFRPNVQKDGYCFACNALCGGCSGMIVNGISIAANPKERFGRAMSTITPAELERFPVQFTLWAKRLEADILLGEFPMFYTHCHQFGQCIYLDLCLYGEDKGTVEREFKIDTEVFAPSPVTVVRKEGV